MHTALLRWHEYRQDQMVIQASKSDQMCTLCTHLDLAQHSRSINKESSPSAYAQSWPSLPILSSRDFTQRLCMMRMNLMQLICSWGLLCMPKSHPAAPPKSDHVKVFAARNGLWPADNSGPFSRSALAAEWNDPSAGKSNG